MEGFTVDWKQISVYSCSKENFLVSIPIFETTFCAGTAEGKNMSSIHVNKLASLGAIFCTR